MKYVSDKIKYMSKQITTYMNESKKTLQVLEETEIVCDTLGI